MESSDWLCAADDRLVEGFDKAFAHVLEADPYDEDTADDIDGNDNPLLDGVTEWFDALVKLLCGYAIEVALVEGGIAELPELPVVNKLGGIPKFNRAFWNVGSFNRVCLSTPSLSKPNLSRNADAAALGLLVRGGIVFELGAGDGLRCLGLGVIAGFALWGKLECHGLTVLRLLFSVLDDEGE